jgi:primosomal protein N' (replication factor Y) (superfamily II helicase)
MSRDPQYLDVAVPKPLRRSFHYVLPGDWNEPVPEPGIRLRVPFGRRSSIGIVLKWSGTTTVSADKVKPVLDVLDTSPVLTAAIMKLCQWAADYYHHPIGEVLFTALPTLVRRGAPLTRDVEVLKPMSIRSHAFGRAVAQRALFDRLQQSKGGLSRRQLKDGGVSGAVIAGLIDKGLANWASDRAEQLHAFDPASVRIHEGPFELTPEQTTAVAAVRGQPGGVSLLHGITGSGKTEVYLQLISQELRAGRQALVLVPEIGLTPQTIQRFTERFDVPIVALHSALSHKDRLDGWMAARSGHCGIVIGTRSAVFTPLKNPGIIVVDEEHDASLKQQDGFRYHARDLAVMRGHFEQIPVVLGSATPSLESWHNATIGKYQKIPLSTRPGASTRVRYQVIDLSQAAPTDGFAAETLAAMSTHLASGNQILVFLNRRGFAPVLLCRHCGWIAECSRCDARMTWHQSSSVLMCHHCGHVRRPVTQCPSCQSVDVVPLGAGTQRIEEDLTRLFPDYPIIRVDRDSTRHKHALSRLVAEIGKGQPAILVGTQLLAKGHHFPNVTMVAIVDMDSGFYSANYKASERMGQLILQVGGRSGRAEKPGIVAIQTCLPGQPIFRRLIDHGYGEFADDLLTERRLHDLPPFSHHALIRAEATNQDDPMRFLQILSTGFNIRPLVQVLGPVPASMERKAGKYRAHLLFASPQRKRLQVTLDQCIKLAETLPESRKVRWGVDVDPLDLF